MKLYDKYKSKIIRESAEIKKTVQIGQIALSTYIEVLEFIESDVKAYFKLGSGISARKTMRRMLDFTTFRLKNLKQLEKEYKSLEVKDEN